MRFFIHHDRIVKLELVIHSGNTLKCTTYVAFERVITDIFHEEG